MIVHKSNNICKNYDFTIKQRFFLLNFAILFYNVNKHQEDPLKTFKGKEKGKEALGVQSQLFNIISFLLKMFFLGIQFDYK